MPILTGVVDLADGQAIVLPASDAIRLTVIAGAGATVTVSRVDDQNAVAHTVGAENQFTVAAATLLVTEVDWPYYRISVAGGSCRVAMV